MKYTNLIKMLNPHSAEQKKESDKRFYSLLEKDFFDYLFFDFCRLEEIKKFLKEFFIATESKSKVVVDDFKVKDVFQVVPTNENRHVLDSMKSILDQFKNNVADLSEKAMASAKVIVNEVVPKASRPELNDKVTVVVEKMFRPDHALSETKKVINHIRSRNPLSIEHVPEYAYKRMNEISSQLNSDQYKKFHQSEFHHHDEDFKNFFSLAMIFASHHSFLNNMKDLKEMPSNDAEKLFNNLHSPVESFCEGVANELKKVIDSVFALSVAHDHHHSASSASPFSMNPYDITHRPK